MTKHNPEPHSICFVSKLETAAAAAGHPALSPSAPITSDTLSLASTANVMLGSGLPKGETLRRFSPQPDQGQRKCPELRTVRRSFRFGGKRRPPTIRSQKKGDCYVKHGQDQRSCGNRKWRRTMETMETTCSKISYPEKGLRRCKQGQKSATLVGCPVAHLLLQHSCLCEADTPSCLRVAHTQPSLSKASVMFREGGVQSERVRPCLLSG